MIPFTTPLMTKLCTRSKPMRFLSLEGGARAATKLFTKNASAARIDRCAEKQQLMKTKRWRLKKLRTHKQKNQRKWQQSQATENLESRRSGPLQVLKMP
mmetsp:Transcript_2131/g.3025  ORF Transcript_2131/g.3025 Transcript_2131/m.3025 type:complete len:99 (+) Transcript_2131:13-309(+)